MKPRLEDGRLYGPGAYDMKGGLVQLVFALQALWELELVSEVTPIVLVNADEELGSPDSRRWITMLARGAERALVLEPPDGLNGRLKTGRKGVGRFRVTILGRAAHAGQVPGGRSAILELAHQVEALFALNDRERGITVNVGTIDGGLRPNMIAPEAAALVDARAPTAAAAERVERAIRRLRPTGPGLTIQVEGGFGRPPMPRTDGNRALSRRARLLARELGLDVAEAPMVGGGSDANYTSELVPTLDGLGAVGDGAHALDEHVVVRSLPEPRCPVRAAAARAAGNRYELQPVSKRPGEIERRDHSHRPPALDDDEVAGAAGDHQLGGSADAVVGGHRQRWGRRDCTGGYTDGAYGDRVGQVEVRDDAPERSFFTRLLRIAPDDNAVDAMSGHHLRDLRERSLGAAGDDSLVHCCADAGGHAARLS